MLLAKITDLKGEELAVVRRIPAPQGGNSTKASVALNGARSAGVRVSVYDEPAMLALRARPTTRMLKVYYRPPGQAHAKLVHWGFIARPKIGFGGQVLEVTSVDATARAKRWFPFLVGKPGGDDGVTIDGPGVERVWRTMQEPIVANYPHAGVVWAGGQHGPSHPGAKAAISDGQSFQDFIDSLSNATDGPDWDLPPLDTTYGDEAPAGMSTSDWNTLRASSPWSFTSQLHTYERKGVDRRQDVSFGFGVGLQNLDDLDVEVGGEQQVNAAQVAVTGATAGAGSTKIAVDPAVSEVGVWAAQQSLSVDPGTGNIDELAQGTADAQVAAYRYAPIFLSLSVKKDELARHHAFFDFEHGDTVRVQGEAGLALIPYRDDFVKEVPARITAIDLQEDAAGRVTQGLTALVDVGEEE